MTTPAILGAIAAYVGLLIGLIGGVLVAGEQKRRRG